MKKAPKRLLRGLKWHMAIKADKFAALPKVAERFQEGASGEL